MDRQVAERRLMGRERASLLKMEGSMLRLPDALPLGSYLIVRCSFAARHDKQAINGAGLQALKGWLVPGAQLRDGITLELGVQDKADHEFQISLLTPVAFREVGGEVSIPCVAGLTDVAPTGAPCSVPPYPEPRLYVASLSASPQTARRGLSFARPAAARVSRLKRQLVNTRRRKRDTGTLSSQV